MRRAPGGDIEREVFIRGEERAASDSSEEENIDGGRGRFIDSVFESLKVEKQPVRERGPQATLNILEVKEINYLGGCNSVGKRKKKRKEIWG